MTLSRKLEFTSQKDHAVTAVLVVSSGGRSHSVTTFEPSSPLFFRQVEGASSACVEQWYTSAQHAQHEDPVEWIERNEGMPFFDETYEWLSPLEWRNEGISFLMRDWVKFGESWNHSWKNTVSQYTIFLFCWTFIVINQSINSYWPTIFRNVGWYTPWNIGLIPHIQPTMKGWNPGLYQLQPFVLHKPGLFGYNHFMQNS